MPSLKQVKKKMKLLVCCLLAITCCVLANADNVERTMKLTEVLKELRQLNKSVEVGQSAIYWTPFSKLMCCKRLCISWVLARNQELLLMIITCFIMHYTNFVMQCVYCLFYIYEGCKWFIESITTISHPSIFWGVDRYKTQPQ